MTRATSLLLILLRPWTRSSAPMIQNMSNPRRASIDLSLWETGAGKGGLEEMSSAMNGPEESIFRAAFQSNSTLLVLCLLCLFVAINCRFVVDFPLREPFANQRRPGYPCSARRGGRQPGLDTRGRHWAGFEPVPPV